MEANTISLKTFTICLAAVVLIETGFRLAVSAKIASSLSALGLIRCLESLVLVTAVLTNEKKIAAIGLSPAKIKYGFGKGLIWSACFGVAAGVLYLLLLAYDIEGLELLHRPGPSSWHRVAAFLVVGGIIGPIAEEIFFRGVVFGFFRRWGAFTAVFVSTLLFVGIHPLGSGIPITQIVGGVVFALAYEKEQNLMVPITIHCLGNLAIFSLTVFF